MAFWRLGHGDEVLAPDKEHVLHRGLLVDDHGLDLPASYRLVQLLDRAAWPVEWWWAGHPKAIAVPEGRLVAWQGYAQRLTDGSEQRGPCARTCVWRCEIWTEGVGRCSPSDGPKRSRTPAFSLFSWPT